MESGPSKIAEGLVFWLLPPACREEVLGDMRERNQGLVEYLIEAMHTVPSVIYSRIQRTTDAVIALMEAVSLYTSYVLSAWWLNRPLLIHEFGFARLAFPPAILLAAIVLADAYSDPKKRWMLKPFLGPILGFALTYVIELNPRWALPWAVLVWGGAFSVLIAWTLRLTFPPVTEWPQTVIVPTFWQKLELLPPSFSPRIALVPAVIFLTLILYLLLSRG